MSVVMCRACLAKTVQTIPIRNTPLQEVYEKLSNTKLISEDGKPETVCYTCYLQLEKCHNFATMSQQADSMLTRFFCRIEIPKSSIAAPKPLDPESPSDLIEVEANIKEELEAVELEIQGNVDIKEEGTESNENGKINKNRYLDKICKPKEHTKERKNKHMKTLACDISETDSYLDEHDMNNSRENTFNDADNKCLTHIHSQTQKPYNCDKCNKTFAHRNNLKAHMKIHVGEKLSACDRCGKTFPSGYQLKRHMRSHTGEKPYNCDQCDRMFSDRSNLKKHMATHSGEKSYICSECNATFSQKGNLQRHMRSHTGEKPYICDICKKALPDASLLKRHIRIHTGERPYVCVACGKSYSDKDNFKTHMRLHTGEKPYKCIFCDYKSAHASCLKLHLAKKHSK